MRGVTLEKPMSSRLVLHWSAILAFLLSLAGAPVVAQSDEGAGSTVGLGLAALGFSGQSAALVSCPYQDHLDLHDETINGTAVYRACLTLSAGPAFKVLSGAYAAFEAGDRIGLFAGFQVDMGATFTARVGVVEVEPMVPLNDTGITACADVSSNDLDCPVSNYPGQDAEHGRDVTQIDDSDGYAGFSFTKLDADGQPLLADAIDWSCVRDNVTGRIWEVKTNDGGLHDWGDTYIWYNPNATTNGGFEGYADDVGDVCYGYDAADPASYCNTQAFVARVNAEGLCGAHDWRLPSWEELLSIVNDDRYYPAIDTVFFPNTSSGWFWSSSPYVGYSSDAWAVDFGYGYVYSNYGKGDAEYVRLVRGEN